MDACKRPQITIVLDERSVEDKMGYTSKSAGIIVSKRSVGVSISENNSENRNMCYCKIRGVRGPTKV